MAVDLHAAIQDAKADELSALLVRALQNLPAAAAPAAPAAPACSCQHHAPAVVPAGSARPRSAARPLAIGAAIVVGGCVLTTLFLAVALTAVAVGVSSVVMLLVVKELRKGGAR
jgi:hypothetical protein